ncbi:hypothetical protein [uncultured Erythrobacter sp.]|uniref:hypothetical protein n=1 Tax=uncultured Erythrobacter sp. TaxID=263913 RepID=UPI002608EAF3|nr:hypothetical protein [uncultured Erythrobacter sp.]
MANSLFENPKIALGFAGVVVAVALVASVALDGLVPSEPVAEQTAEAETPLQTQATPAASPAAGWASDSGTTSDWGAPRSSSQAGFAEAPDDISEVPVDDYRPVQTASRARARQAGSPTITTRAAPGAPEVAPPRSGQSAQIEEVGN